MFESWSREEWKRRLKEIGHTPASFAVACNFSMTTLNKIFGKKYVHDHTLKRTQETYVRFRDQSRAAG